jgi:hypothetical protein
VSFRGFEGVYGLDASKVLMTWFEGEVAVVKKRAKR